MATNMSVRLDDDTERKLDELVEYFNASLLEGITVGRVKRSDVVRAAIESLHDAQVRRGGIR
jgi:Arc/MetJ-type ribon-helix-helix transcriptional regulator